VKLRDLVVNASHLPFLGIGALAGVEKKLFGLSIHGSQKLKGAPLLHTNSLARICTEMSLSGYNINVVTKIALSSVCVSSIPLWQKAKRLV